MKVLRLREGEGFQNMIVLRMFCLQELECLVKKKKILEMFLNIFKEPQEEYFHNRNKNILDD